MTHTLDLLSHLESLSEPDQVERHSAPLCIYCQNGTHEILGVDTVGCSCPCHGRPR